MSWYGVTSVCFGYFMIFIYARIDQMIPEQNGPTDSAQVHVWWGIWLAAGAALRVQMERPSIGPWFTEFPGFDPQQLACNPCLNFKPISLSHIKQNICLKKQNKHINKKKKHICLDPPMIKVQKAWESNIILRVRGGVYDMISYRGWQKCLMF